MSRVRRRNEIKLTPSIARASLIDSRCRASTATFPMVSSLLALSVLASLSQPSSFVDLAAFRLKCHSKWFRFNKIKQDNSHCSIRSSHLKRNLRWPFLRPVCSHVAKMFVAALPGFSWFSLSIRRFVDPTLDVRWSSRCWFCAMNFLLPFCWSQTDSLSSRFRFRCSAWPAFVVP